MVLSSPRMKQGKISFTFILALLISRINNLSLYGGVYERSKEMDIYGLPSRR